MVKSLKLFDKFLKFLKTDRNTFLTYILTLITIYLTIDRVVEMLLMVFTGIGNSYWGPIAYTFAFACPIFAFLFSCSSKFADSEKTKVSFFYMYVISLYLLFLSFVNQSINSLCWLALMSAPSYVKIATEYSSLIAPAFRAVSLYLPLTTFYPLIRWILTQVGDTKLLLESIYEYSGINLSPSKSKAAGQFSCDVLIGTDKRTGKSVVLPEDRRFESTLVVGVSGSGKTSLMFEPLIARDIEKKRFLHKSAKEYGFAALKSGVATINAPYDNKYINDNFSLNMLTANSEKSGTYKSCMKNMIRSSQDNKIIYRDMGLTYISPDFESISRVIKVAENYNVKYNLIDPNHEDSIGLNPFAYDNPLQTSVIISTVLRNLHTTSNADKDLDLGVQANFASQAIENLSILMKVMYPRMHEGATPTLEDMLNAFNDFSIIQDMCENLEKDEELSNKFSILIKYFKNNYYNTSSRRENTEKYISSAITQLDNLLRYPGMRKILCNRTNNINFDVALANGEFTFVCTRRGDLGEAAHTAFGLFFILSMQYAVLRRPGIESSRIPHFLYIDEFASFVSSSTEPIFTLYRKYRVGSMISVQNLDQLNAYNKKYRKTIIANCAHKIVFGNNEPEDNEWWSKELGTKKEFAFGQSYDTTKGEYSSTLSSIKYDTKPNFPSGKIQSIKFKECFYKIRDGKGKNNVGIAKLNFIDSKYKEKQKEVQFNFEKFTNGMSYDDSQSIKKKSKKSRIPTFVDDDNTESELDPIRTTSHDSLFGSPDDGTAIVNHPNIKKNNN